MSAGHHGLPVTRTQKISPNWYRSTGSSSSIVFSSVIGSISCFIILGSSFTVLGSGFTMDKRHDRFDRRSIINNNNVN